MGIKKLQSDGYFEELPKGTQEIVKELVLQAANARKGPDGYKSDKEALESVECRSRDGFIAFSHNKGGLMYRNFCDLMDYFGGGYTPAHEGASKEIERQIELGFSSLAESVFADNKALLESKNLTVKDCEYHKINELAEKDEDLQDVLQQISDGENEVLGGTENSVMHEIRFMYHGLVDGKHSASVSAAVNTEGPYHRSSISWAPGVFCEGAKEVEIEWSNQTELKEKLTKALSKVSKAIF